jgi:Leucine-rich repeat (LRR) protein
MDGSLSAVTFLFLAFLIIHPNLLCNGDSESEVTCIETERQALLRFKQHLQDPSNRLASWVGDGDCCQWVGVVCHNVTGHVHELHLRSFPPVRDDFVTDEEQYRAQYGAYMLSMFGGKINHSLLDLKHLNYLDLSYNDFSDIQIPEFLGSMGSLRYLNLSNARFQGVIPHQLGNLSNLHYLNLAGNGLYAMNLQWLSGLPLLQYLDMSHVDLSKASDWLQVINKLPSLLDLQLLDCELRFIPPTPSVNFSSLATLDLSSNYFENSSILSWIFGYRNLVSLDLSGNHFQGPIPVDLQNMTSLRHLDLSENYFNHSIPNWLYSFSHLEFLKLAHNNLQGTISSAIGNLTSAITIDLSDNELEGKVPRSLGNLCNLREIILSSNKWSQEISEIIESLSGCLSYRLETLYLEDAQLSGHLTNEIGQFKNLVRLSFVYNSISGPIPVSLGNLSSLRFLDLSNNQFNGTLPQKFWQFKNLVLLTVSKNSLSGPILVSLGNLSSLKNLDLSYNQFSGTLPQNFGQFKNLLRLSFFNNSISGPIPMSLGNHSSLRILDLAYNQFNGTLPQNFGQLSKLKTLFIESNMLEGVVSEVHFSNLTKLSEFYAFGNQLTLEVSHDWIPPFQIRELSLRSWILGPKFPSWLCSQIHLQYLDISNTGISDVFPLSFWNLSSQLGYLNLSHNLIYGEIPNSPEILSTSSVIDLSSNHFKGPLPCISSDVIVLDLSNNSFSGSISHFLCY